MNNNQEIQSIHQVVANYATALNTSDASALAALYAQNGSFKAKHNKAITSSDEIQKKAEHFFNKYNFTIELDVANIRIQENVALVCVNGKSRTAANGKIKLDKTDDFFVLVRKNNKWKVFSYFIYESI